MNRLFRYTIVGIFSNLLGYLAYLFLTFLSLPPKLSMTIVYIVGASSGFFGNRQWTFKDSGKVRYILPRYLFAHLIGYTLNFFILHIYVDNLKYPHQIVQGFAIIIGALILFYLQKKFIFTKPTY